MTPPALQHPSSPFCILAQTYPAVSGRNAKFHEIRSSYLSACATHPLHSRPSRAHAQTANQSQEAGDQYSVLFSVQCSTLRPHTLLSSFLNLRSALSSACEAEAQFARSQSPTNFQPNSDAHVCRWDLPCRQCCTASASLMQSPPSAKQHMGTVCVESVPIRTA